MLDSARADITRARRGEEEEEEEMREEEEGEGTERTVVMGADDCDEPGDDRFLAALALIGDSAAVVTAAALELGVLSCE